VGHIESTRFLARGATPAIVRHGRTGIGTEAHTAAGGAAHTAQGAIKGAVGKAR